MTHDVILADDAALLDHAGRVVVDLAASCPGRLALALSLLNDTLVDRCTLRTASGSVVLRLTRSSREREVIVERHGHRQWSVSLGHIELERWLTFFLKYFRDGAAEVDHLDLDGLWHDGARCDLTLKVAGQVPQANAATRPEGGKRNARS